jgi:drug/metabolite transporter (DMT)-like permease
MAEEKEKIRSGLVAGIIAASIWGGMYVVSDWVLDVIAPFTLLTFRLLLGVVALGLWRAGKEKPNLDPSQIAKFLAIGALGYGLSLGFQFQGTLLSTAATGAIVTAATPAFVFLFAAILYKEVIRRKRWIALILSSLGILLVLDLNSTSIAMEHIQGTLFLAAAALTWALFSVLVSKATRAVDAMSFTFIALQGGFIVSLPGTYWELAKEPLSSISFPILLGILYLGLIATAVAFYLWNKAFELLDPGMAALTFFAQPLVGTGLAALFLGEKFSPSFVIGGWLIILGIYLAASSEGNSKTN